jgi:glycosyltransferase involved in cell wall biosynthesis
MEADDMKDTGTHVSEHISAVGDGVPSVSVIVPCFNQSRYLRDAVCSLQAQTVSDWECIIIDDGSTDDSLDVGTMLANSDSRVRCIHQANAGVSSARNHGLKLAHGRYIQFLDADDVILPQKFQSQLDLILQSDRIAVSYCDYYYCNVDQPGSVITELYVSPILDEADPLADIALGWETRLTIPIHCFLFDARLFREHDIKFDVTLPSNEDWDCWMQIFAMKPAVLYVDRKLAVYRLHPGSTTSDGCRMRRGFLRALHKQVSLFSHDTAMLRILRRKIAITKRAYRDYAPVRKTWLRITARPRMFLKRHLSQNTKSWIRRLLTRTAD